jgi:hypothetical protein
MTSILVHHQEASRFSPLNPAKGASLAIRKERSREPAAARFDHPNTKRFCCSSAKRDRVMRACFKLWSIVAIGLSLLAPSLRAEFLYVVSSASNNISAYHIGEDGTLKPVAGSPFPPAGIEPGSVAVDLLGRFVYVTNAESISP